MAGGDLHPHEGAPQGTHREAGKPIQYGEDTR